MLGFTDRQIYKIFLAIKQRYKKYGVVGFSRLEHDRFGVSERRLQRFIELLKKDKKFVKVGMVKGNNNPFKCNIYKLSKEFHEFLEKVREYTQKTFEYIKYTPEDVINYVSTLCIKKYGQWKFTIEGNTYIVAEKGKYRGKIYDTENRKIISLITLQNAR